MHHPSRPKGLALDPSTAFLAFVVWRLLGTEVVARFKKTRFTKALEVRMKAMTKTSATAWLALR
ncbi:hypothetical protein GCM10007853_17580 [Algimonas ampicilliniresistens]|uniref:Uncharacterized protein n=1 Tax=Algimonas ampicilliniresistens TaxID=1298735 RepID=A0ABQ5V8N7_9PROT|nr:hypothetical protein [Algimonas ampicilliniresistens]GLQ23884.1 hypothetical protein GCM10007853_17580 [Algimonas ampicilliniresistens]